MALLIFYAMLIEGQPLVKSSQKERKLMYTLSKNKTKQEKKKKKRIAWLGQV